MELEIKMLSGACYTGKCGKFAGKFEELQEILDFRDEAFIILDTKQFGSVIINKANILSVREKR